MFSDRSTAHTSSKASSSKTTALSNDVNGSTVASTSSIVAESLPDDGLPPDLLTSFYLMGEHVSSYKHQFANVYFMRLAELRPVVQTNAEKMWRDVTGNPVFVPRVLDVIKGQFSYIVGTVYMDMPLKPNVLLDIEKDQWVTAPPPRTKFHSPDDSVLLEDDSGRIKLVGEKLEEIHLVTGVIMAALGVETSTGEFRVVDLCFAEMAPNYRRWRALADGGKKEKRGATEVDGIESKGIGKWIALVSGFDLSSADVPSGTEHSADIRLQMLIEYLKGESGGSEDQQASSEVKALVILGNSIDVPRRATDDSKNAKRYNQQPAWDPAPLSRLTLALKDLASSIPVHLLPGTTDPAPSILPQQPMPRAMFGFEPGKGKVSGTLSCETNPAWIDVGGDGLLATSGQNLDDMYKYVESEDRLEMVTNMLRWRHIAPTCPDTLWCYPFFDGDPFLLRHTPGIYAIGNQPSFASELVVGLAAGEDRVDGSQGGERTRTRVVLVPRFSTSGEVVFVHSGTLAVKRMRFGLASGWASG